VDVLPVEPASPLFEVVSVPAPAAGTVSVVASHYPIISQAPLLSRAGLPYYGDLIGRAGVAASLCERDEPIVILNGHIHARCSVSTATLLQLSVGALVEPPFDCTLIDVDADDGIVVRRTAIRLGAVAAVNPVFAHDDECWVWDGAGWHAGVDADAVDAA
jgi:hypothetical protein